MKQLIVGLTLGIALTSAVTFAGRGPLDYLYQEELLDAPFLPERGYQPGDTTDPRELQLREMRETNRLLQQRKPC